MFRGDGRAGQKFGWMIFGRRVVIPVSQETKLKDMESRKDRCGNVWDTSACRRMEVELKC